MTGARNIAADLVELRRRVDALGRPGLGHSSYEGAIQEYNGGQLVARIGRQFDGTHGAVVVSGPVPPTPAGLSARPVVGGVEFTWDGTWAAGGSTVAPGDFSRVEVHSDVTPDLSGLLFDTLRGTIESPRGGSVFVPTAADQQVYGLLVARTLPGRTSAPSAVVGPVAAAKIERIDIGFDLDDLAGTMIYGPDDEPTTQALGDLWLRRVGVVDGVDQHETVRWTPGAPGEPGFWKPLPDQGVTQALVDAAAAHEAAEAANQKGIDALAAAAAAQDTADAKVTIYRQADPPAETTTTGTYPSANTYPSTSTYPGAATSDAGSLGPNSYWIRASDELLHRWDGADWVPVQDAAIRAAIEDAATAQATADGKMRIIPLDTPPTGMTAGDVGDLWINTSPGAGNRTATWDGADWVPRLIGNAAIAPQSLVASDVVATGTVSAALLEAIMVLTNVIIAGNPDGAHSRMDEDGFAAYSPSPLIGAPPYRVVSMGSPTQLDTIGVRDEAGNLLTNFDQTGYGTVRAFNIRERLQLDGRDLVDDIEWNLPWGSVGWGWGNPDQAGIVNDTQLIAARWTAKPGRQYKITVSNIRFANSSTGIGVGATFTLRSGSTELTRKLIDNPSGVMKPGQELVFVYRDSQSGDKFADLWVSANGASVHAQFDGNAPYTINIEDVGPLRPHSGITFAASSPETSGKRQYVWEQPASWSTSYRENGAPRTDAAGKLYQGYYPDGFNGNNRSLIGWPDVTALLSGADVQQVLVYLYANHWYNGAGGTAVIGAHALASQPGSFAGLIAPDRMQVNFARAEGKWVDVTAWGPEFKAGSVRGVVLGPGPNTNFMYYGSFHGHSISFPPKLRIVYAK